MSIILKGIDMPKDTEGMGITFYTKDGWRETHILDVTQAIQIDRPHGRLIDWEAFNNKLDIQYPEGRGKSIAPTIIEAEV